MAQNSTAPAASALTLPSDREILITRAFKAPRELVWRAFTDAALLPRWMGYAQFAMTTSEMDVRPGGAYKWVWKMDEGDLVLQGRFVEVDPPKRLVSTQTMGGSDLHTPETLNSLTLTEKHGWTTAAILITVASKQERDAMLATGMKEGMDYSYARLDGLLGELA
jgi:uncharacterized protein YndB with AHSA1/START domain